MAQPGYRAPSHGHPCDALPAYVRAALTPRGPDVPDAEITALAATFAQQAREADARRRRIRDASRARQGAPSSTAGQKRGRGSKGRAG